MLMDAMGESKSIGGDCCWGDDEKGRRTMIDQRTLTSAEKGSCFQMRSFCPQVAVDELIKLDSSKNIWETTRASDGRGFLDCTRIAC